MSEFKTNKIKPVDPCSTTTLGESGDTIATGTGTTLDIQGTYSGINAISWDTTAKTANFTAETNKGYFIDTSSSGVTVTLPATPSAGSFIGIKDYALTAQTNNIRIGRNGNNIQGAASDVLITTQGGVANLVYVDATQGWLTFDAAQASDIAETPTFITATGGTITTCGNFKIHTFTSPGTFCVSSIGNCATPSTYRDKVDYLVIAGGGGGGTSRAGGGGAGGYRESSGASGGCYSTSPLGSGVSALSVTATAFPITVGGGGAGGNGPVNESGVQGSNSVFSTITSTGGGIGRSDQYPAPAPSSDGGPGGSGGGGVNGRPGGSGNSPPVSPPQGRNGGTAVESGPNYGAGGGGGAGAVGSNGSSSAGGNGGNGVATSITTSSVTRSGGGGGGQYTTAATPSGGSGGGGGGGSYGGRKGVNGTTNTGGGGGGGAQYPNPSGNQGGGTGGSGIVVIRYRYQ